MLRGDVSATARSMKCTEGSAYNIAMKTAAGFTLAAAVAVTLGASPQQPGSAGSMNRTITAVPGIKVGHFTLAERPTGCTVILVEGDAVGGVSQRGGAPGTRE